MTQKEIEALQLSLGKDGFALCKKSRTGALMRVRKITNQEFMTMLSLMYAQHITENPEDKIMLLPLDNEGHALAVTFAEIAAQPKKKSRTRKKKE